MANKKLSVDNELQLTTKNTQELNSDGLSKVTLRATAAQVVQNDTMPIEEDEHGNRQMYLCYLVTTVDIEKLYGLKNHMLTEKGRTFFLRYATTL